MNRVVVGGLAVTQHTTISIPADDPLWAVVDCWHYLPDPQHPNARQTPRRLTFTVDDEPIF